jgi:Obg family GTPase CgtA-like protein
MLDLSRVLEEGGKLNPETLVSDYRAIRKELEAHSPALAKKKELVVLNKTDLTTVDLTPLIETLEKEGITLSTCISAATAQGTEELTKTLLPLVLAERTKRMKISEKSGEDLPTLRPHEESTQMGAYRIEEEDDRVVVRGKRIEQFAKMTNFMNEGGVQRFRDVVRRIGLLKALHALNLKEDTPIFIGEIQVDQYL